MGDLQVIEMSTCALLMRFCSWLILVAAARDEASRSKRNSRAKTTAQSAFANTPGKPAVVMLGRQRAFSRPLFCRFSNPEPGNTMKIELANPITVGGDLVSSLTFRRMTAGDLRAAANASNPVDAVSVVLARMAGLTDVEFDAIDLADLGRINEQTAPLIDAAGL